jgi:hypothetical protein
VCPWPGDGLFQFRAAAGDLRERGAVVVGEVARVG